MEQRTLNRLIADEPGKSVAVGVASTLVVPENPYRDELVVVNDSDVVIYLRLGDGGATVGAGMRLNPNGGSYTTEKYGGPVSAIHGATGTKNVTVMEL